MRELLFRGIPFDWNQFVFGNYVMRNGVHNIQTMMTDDKTGKKSLVEVPVIPETVGQYIGIFDVKDKRVFQGDIINFDDTAIGGYEARGEVIWNDDISMAGLGWHLWMMDNNDRYHAGFRGMSWIGEVEIVGNIHEEVLKNGHAGVESNNNQ